MDNTSGYTGGAVVAAIITVLVVLARLARGFYGSRFRSQCCGRQAIDMSAGQLTPTAAANGGAAAPATAAAAPTASSSETRPPSVA